MSIKMLLFSQMLCCKNAYSLLIFNYFPPNIWYRMPDGALTTPLPPLFKSYDFRIFQCQNFNRRYSLHWIFRFLQCVDDRFVYFLLIKFKIIKIKISIIQLTRRPRLSFSTLTYTLFLNSFNGRTSCAGPFASQSRPMRVDNVMRTPVRWRLSNCI